MADKNYIIEVKEARFAHLYRPFKPNIEGITLPIYQIGFHHTDLPDPLRLFMERDIASSEERDGENKGFIRAWTDRQPVIVAEGDTYIDGRHYNLERLYAEAEASRFPMDLLINETGVRINVRTVEPNNRVKGMPKAPRRLMLIAVEVSLDAVHEHFEELKKAVMSARDWEDLA